MGRLFWIIQLGPEYKLKGSYRREARRSQRRRQCDGGSRGRSDAARIHRTPQPLGAETAGTDPPQSPQKEPARLPS